MRKGSVNLFSHKRRHKTFRIAFLSLSHLHWDWIWICFLALFSRAVKSVSAEDRAGGKKRSKCVTQKIFSASNMNCQQTTSVQVCSRVRLFTSVCRRRLRCVGVWHVVSARLQVHRYSVICSSTSGLWLQGNFRRRFAVEGSNTCTCHLAL